MEGNGRKEAAKALSTYPLWLKVSFAPEPGHGGQREVTVARAQLSAASPALQLIDTETTWLVDLSWVALAC